MGSMVSGLADAVLGVVQGVGLSGDTVARYGKCCEAVVEFCERQGLDALSGSVVDEFTACQQERARHGEIGRNRRNALVKTARMMLEFQQAGRVAWRMTSPDPGLTGSSGEVLEQFAAAAGQEVAPGSARLLAGEVRHFLAYLDRAGRDALGVVTVDDVRGFMVEMAPRRPAGIGNVVWALRRFFAFLNAAGLSDVRVDGLLAHAAPRRVRALPCFTREETGRLLEGIETGTPCGKRDYAMVALAVSTGLRCCDIVALRLDEIDWRRDEIRLVQAKTSKPLVDAHLKFPSPGQYVKIRRVCGVPGAVNVASGAVSASGGGTLISIPYWAAYSCRSPMVRRDVAGGSAAGGSGMACSARSRRVRAVTWLTVVG
jgi:hypothetical protein